MSNTIELLETIGRDASLRHASGSDLAQSLAGMHASEQLQKAVATGDIPTLEKELGHRDMQVTKSPTQTGFDDENEQEKEQDRVPGQEDNNHHALPSK